MWFDWLAAGGAAGLIAESSKALFAWTPTTFYIASAVVHTLVIWLGYQLLGGDREYNNFPSALGAAAVGNVLAYFLRDFGVVGVAGTFGGYFLLLLLTSGIDIFRTVVVFILVMSAYWGFGTIVVERTPLDVYSIGGVPQVEMTGGYKNEPIERPEKKDPNDSIPDP